MLTALFNCSLYSPGSPVQLMFLPTVKIFSFDLQPTAMNIISTTPVGPPWRLSSQVLLGSVLLTTLQLLR